MVGSAVMHCPHSLIGDASSCSQCIGAKPKRVAWDLDTGVLTVDGVPLVRRFQPAASAKYQTSKKHQAGEASRRTAKRLRGQSAGVVRNAQHDDDSVGVLDEDD